MSFTRPSRLLSPTRERIKVRGPHAVRTEEARCVYAPSRSAAFARPHESRALRVADHYSMMGVMGG
jgi:hypothetical protein